MLQKRVWRKFHIEGPHIINPLNAELNPTCHLLALLGAHHIFHVGGLRVKHHRAFMNTLLYGWSWRFILASNKERVLTLESRELSYISGRDSRWFTITSVTILSLVPRPPPLHLLKWSCEPCSRFRFAVEECIPILSGIGSHSSTS